MISESLGSQFEGAIAMRIRPHLNGQRVIERERAKAEDSIGGRGQPENIASSFGFGASHNYFSTTYGVIRR